MISRFFWLFFFFPILYYHKVSEKITSITCVMLIVFCMNVICKCIITCIKIFLLINLHFMIMLFRVTVLNNMKYLLCRNVWLFLQLNQEYIKTTDLVHTSVTGITVLYWGCGG